MAQIQFSRGLVEEAIPEVRLTRSRSGNSGKAIFYFNSPTILGSERADGITGMYMIDEEGEIMTKDVKGKFINGKIEAVEAILVLNSSEEWDRFMRFMNRYAEENGLGFNQA